MSDLKIKLIFIGTPDFGVPALSALIDDERFDILTVITQPDKKVGRQQIVSPPPIKVLAQSFSIPILQPEKIVDCLDSINKLMPDVIVVIAYSQIVPLSILNTPKLGCINVHGSLLPKYRGAACIQEAILKDEKETGITIMKMDEGLDTGPILSQAKIKIEAKDTAGTLFEKLSQLAPDLLIDTIIKYSENKIQPQPQSGASSYAKKLTKENGRIDWHKDSHYIQRFIRAMTPWPSAYTTFEKKILKIISVVPEPLEVSYGKPGMVMSIDNKIAIQTGTGALVIKNIQLEGKKEMSIDEFVKGHKIINTILG